MKVAFLAVIVAVIGLQGSVQAVDLPLDLIKNTISSLLPGGCIADVVVDPNQLLSGVTSLAGGTLTAKVHVKCLGLEADCTATVKLGGINPLGALGSVANVLAVKLVCPKPLENINVEIPPGAFP